MKHCSSDSGLSITRMFLIYKSSHSRVNVEIDKPCAGTACSSA